MEPEGGEGVAPMPPSGAAPAAAGAVAAAGEAGALVSAADGVAQVAVEGVVEGVVLGVTATTPAGWSARRAGTVPTGAVGAGAAASDTVAGLGTGAVPGLGPWGDVDPASSVTGTTSGEGSRASPAVSAHSAAACSSTTQAVRAARWRGAGKSVRRGVRTRQFTCGSATPRPARAHRPVALPCGAAPHAGAALRLPPPRAPAFGSGGRRRPGRLWRLHPPR
jgi:hypothetical protein